MSQNRKILNCLREHAGSYVAMPVLAEAANCYAVHSRISDLRRAGHRIDNLIEVRDGVKASFYRLEPE